MYIEMYLFYISLAGVILMLLYKVIVIRRYDRVNKNSIHFDPFPKTRLRVLQVFQVIAGIVRRFLIKPLGKLVFLGVVVLVRFANYLWTKMRQVGALFKKNKVVLGYIWKIRKLKKKIQKRLRKDLKD